jgi:endonuclease/exonuclease/phosphatase family metal-dependent hydrolase
MPVGHHSFTAMTFNVRYDEESDGTNCWSNRRDRVAATIRAHDPDLLALQEPTAVQWTEIAARLDGMREIEGAGFVRASRFDVRESGVFEVSPRASRTCAWARLRDRAADRPLVFALTHLDTAAGTWLPSAVLLRAKLDAVTGDAAIVLAGDFNCAAGSDAHRYLLDEAGYRDTWYACGRTDDGAMTYNGFAPLTTLPADEVELQSFLDATSPSDGEFAHYQAHVRRYCNYRIDWILIRGALAAASASIDYGDDHRRPASDHYPAIASIIWQ